MLVFGSNRCTFLETILLPGVHKKLPVTCISFYAAYYIPISCISSYSSHFVHLIICISLHAYLPIHFIIASHSMHCIICILSNATLAMHFILNISFYSMQPTLWISFGHLYYATYYMHLIRCIFVDAYLYMHLLLCILFNVPSTHIIIWISSLADHSIYYSFLCILTNFKNHCFQTNRQVPILWN